MRQKVLTVTKDHCRWEYFPVGGNGGQKQNKTAAGARCTHEPSGAVGVSRESRHQHENRRLAFRRMAESAKFRMWVADRHAEISRGETAEAVVARAMEPQNLVIEVKDQGRWVPKKLEA